MTPADLQAMLARAEAVPPKCSCTYEAGDSDCMAHPSDEDGVPLPWPQVASRGALAADVVALVGEVERLRKYEEAVHYLRRKIDGYDSTFAFCGVDDYKEEEP